MNPRQNIELKARVDDLELARAAALAYGARPAGVEHQRDTFFDAPSGRLKLREGEEGARLIWYARSDDTRAVASDYYLVEVAEPEALRMALAAALGVRGVVRKRRELLWWDRVRIHLDVVDGLGSFVEFEAVIRGDVPGLEPEAAQRAVQELSEALEIRAEDRVSVAYADLLELRADAPDSADGLGSLRRGG